MVGLKREVERSPVQRGKRLSGDTQRVKKTRVGHAESGLQLRMPLFIIRRVGSHA